MYLFLFDVSLNLTKCETILPTVTKLAKSNLARFVNYSLRVPPSTISPSSSRFSLTQIVKGVHVTFPDECTISLSFYVSSPSLPFLPLPKNRHHPTFHLSQFSSHSSSSSSSPPFSTNQTPLRTPPSRTTPLNPQGEESPTSQLLAQLGGLSLRDSANSHGGQGQSPLGRRTRAKQAKSVEESVNFEGRKGSEEEDEKGSSLGLMGIRASESRDSVSGENGRQRTTSRE